jgi:hypothetical protein
MTRLIFKLSAYRGALYGIGVFALIAAAGPTSAAAQDSGRAAQQVQRFSLGPTVGLYLPATELLKAITGQSLKQESGIAMGGQMGIALSQRLGLQLTGSFVPCDLSATLDSTSQTTTAASLFFGAGKLSYSLLPPTSPISLQLNGGVALVKRGGTAYQNLKDKTSVGGTVGAQLGVRLSSLPPLQLAVETYLYKQNLDGLITDTGEKASQKDVQLSLGFGVPFGD